MSAGLTASLLLLGCATGAGRMDPAQPIGAEIIQAPSMPVLPAPSTLKLPSFTEAGLLHLGPDYAPELPYNNISVVEPHLRFEPHWENSQSPPDSLAYAGYGFDLSGYDRDDTLRLEWAAAPPGASSWIGLADFSRDRWLWLQPDAAHTVTTDFAALLDGQTTLVAIVLLTGTQQCRLASIRVGAQIAPQISDVQPRSGYAGQMLAISATLTGTEVLTYAWNFGGGATPNTSSASAPNVTLGTPGSYTCTLIVSNGAGSHTFHFSLAVEDLSFAGPWPMYGCDSQHSRRSTASGPTSAPHLAWSFRTTGHYFCYSEPAFGADGTIYLGSTPWWPQSPEVIALNPDGTLKWRSERILPQTPVTVAQDGTLYVGGFTAIFALDPQGQILWRYEASQVIDSPITVASNGDLIFGTEPNLMHCIKPDGTFRWTYAGITTHNPFSGRAALAQDGTIYFGSADYNLYALYPDGSLKWSYATSNQVTAPPIVAPDGTVYFGNVDSTLYALNPAGALLWTYHTAPDAILVSCAIGPDGSIYVSSLHDENSQYGTLHALNSDGTLQWTIPLNDYMMWNGPTVTSEGTIIIGHGHRSVSAYDPAGNGLWTYTGEDDGYWGVFHNPLIAPDGTIYVNFNNGIFQALTSTGDAKWVFMSGGTVITEPSVDAAGVVYFSSADRFTYALNPDGSLKWSFQTPQEVLTPAIDRDGTVYLASEDGNLYALNTDGTLRWNYMLGDKSAADPVISADGGIGVSNKLGEAFMINPDGSLRWKYAGTRNHGVSDSVLMHPNNNLLFNYSNGIWGITSGGQEEWSFGGSDNDRRLLAVSASGTIFCSLDNALQSLSAAGIPGWNSSAACFNYSEGLAVSPFGDVYAPVDDVDYQSARTLLALNPDGSVNWSLPADQGRYSSLALDAVGTIYAVCRSTDLTAPDKLIAVSSAGEKQWELALPASDYNALYYLSPVLGTNHTLYVGGEGGQLFAYSD